MIALEWNASLVGFKNNNMQRKVDARCQNKGSKSAKMLLSPCGYRVYAVRQTTKLLVYILCTYIGKELPILCFSDAWGIDHDYKDSSL